MGLALGKSRSEIRKLPYPEFKDWKTFSLIEPFGFDEREYRTGAVLAQLHNVNVAKKKDLKSPVDYMRNMAKEVLKWFSKEKEKEAKEFEYYAMSDEQKARFIEQQVSTLFGKPVRKKE